MHAMPAYTTVSARQSFSRHDVIPAPPPPPPPEQPKKKSDRQWPDSVRQYVQRCFAEGNSIPGVSRSEMEVKLKKIITEAADNNKLNIVDWHQLPLPQQMIQEERNNFYIMPPVVATSDQMSNLNFQETNLSSNGTPSKKRKSNDYVPVPDADMATSPLPPWRSNTNNVMYDGQHVDKRFRKNGHGKNKQSALDDRKRRFDFLNAQPAPYVSTHPVSPDPEIKRGPIVGTCQTLEKKYFRLTAPPNPETVRPLPVLEETLELLKSKWRKDNNYGYICDQFKSLRQDLTVQHIRTEFTVTVYEIHARIALEKGDLGEYNQCQTQLRLLYKQQLGGHPTEFKAYRILYFLYTTNKTDMNDALADLTTAEKSAPAVKHALDARSSLALGNFHRFFKLYLETPNMGAYLMDMFVSRERLAALANMAKA